MLLTLLTLAFLAVTLIDIIRRDDAEVKYLPKLVWIILVILIPLVGGIVWWAIGREYSRTMTVRLPYAAPASAPAEIPARAADGRSTEEQIADLDREIEEWRLREEIAKRKRERGEASDAG